MSYAQPCDIVTGAVVNICFICTSLEPGRDGVGDYTLKLSREISRRGGRSHAIAINDKYIERVQETMDAQGNHLLRIPGHLPPKVRYGMATERLKEWAPQWTSLQFVSWGYGWKGVVAKEAFYLRDLLQGTNRHIMFHEPWVWLNKQAKDPFVRTIKLLVLGILQKYSIAFMATLLRPYVAHTSNTYYSSILKSAGIATHVLPLFSNIEINSLSDWGRVKKIIGSRTPVDLHKGRGDYVVFGAFGDIRAQWDAAPLFEKIAHLARHYRRDPIFLHFGVVSDAGKEILASWKTAFPEIAWLILGPQEQADLSLLANELDFAISQHPAQAVGRSGSAAMLLEHGVPLILSWGESFSSDDGFANRWRGLLVSSQDDLSGLFTGAGKAAIRSSAVEAAADALLNSLHAVIAHS